MCRYVGSTECGIKRKIDLDTDVSDIKTVAALVLQMDFNSTYAEMS